MMRVKSIVLKDTVTPALNRIIDDLTRRRGLLGAVGRRVVNELRAHFQVKEGQPNKSGWPKGHLWARIAKNTNIRSLSEREVVIGIGGADAGPIFLKRMEGGVIKPKEKKYLAIPINRMAAGKYPSANLIPGVFLTYRKVGGQLQKFLATGEKNNPAGQLLHWVLKKSVMHPKDPTALPPDGKINAAINDEAGKYLDRLTRANA